MTSLAPEQSLLLPEGTRALYIGAPKTGTTTLQRAAARHRQVLARHGVYYPGRAVNHRRAIYAALGRPERPVGSSTNASSMEVPDGDEWQRFVLDVVAKDFDRTLVSHETASTATDTQAASLVDALGRDRTHVIVTLRPVAPMLCARWSELLKEGEADPFDVWLGRALGRAEPPLPPVMRRYLHMGDLVSRWAKVVGPDNVTVIVVDKTRRSMLTGTFEQLLGLPAGTLAGTVTAGDETNRSMSLPEAELFRRVNAELAGPNKIPWRLYLAAIRSGAVGRLLRERTPADDEPRITLPESDVANVTAAGREYAAAIRNSGVRIVGDIDRLSEAPTDTHGADPARDAESSGPADPDRIDTSIAVAALVGAVRAVAQQQRHGQPETTGTQ